MLWCWEDVTDTLLGGARAHMTPTSLCMICAANHIMRFPDRPCFLFSQLCKGPLFGKYCISEGPQTSWCRGRALNDLLIYFFKMKLARARLARKRPVRRGRGQKQIRRVGAVAFESQSLFLLTLFLFMQCNMQRCQGHGAISYSLYVLMDPFFTWCLILLLGACSWPSRSTAVPAHQWGSALLS